MNQHRFRYFEDGIQSYITKVLIALTVYIFVLEPIIYKYWIQVFSYDYLESAKFLFGGLILCISAVLGFYHGKSKRVPFSFLGSFIFLLICYSMWLGTFRYTLSPIGNSIWFKYVSLVLVFPICSMVTFIILNFGKFRIHDVTKVVWSINKFDSVLQDSSIIKLNLDQSLGDIHNKSKQEIEKVDILGYYPLAEGILNSITTLNPPKAFSIGINGGWGAGKSSLISILTDKLIPDYNSTMNEHYNQFREIRVISFSPWLYPDDDSLVSNFFARWRDEMNDPVMKILFDDYGSVLKDIKIGGMIVKLQNLFARNKSL